MKKVLFTFLFIFSLLPAAARQTYIPSTYSPSTYVPPDTYVPSTYVPRTYVPQIYKPQIYAPNTYKSKIIVSESKRFMIKNNPREETNRVPQKHPEVFSDQP